MALGLQERFLEVRNSIQQACRDHGRDPETVHLLAVSKTFPLESIRALAQWGQLDFAENYVQEAASKAPQCPELCWHLIGPLQRNKAGQALDMFGWIHSLDRLELGQRLNRLALERGKVLKAFVQVRLGDEESKSGLDPANLLPEMARWNEQGWQGLQLMGLMTLPPPESSRPHFARLRQLAEELRREGWPLFTDYQLSMGMSDDFEVAIAEGSHWVRIGRALFGSRG